MVKRNIDCSHLDTKWARSAEAVERMWGYIEPSKAACQDPERLLPSQCQAVEVIVDEVSLCLGLLQCLCRAASGKAVAAATANKRVLISPAYLPRLVVVD